MSDKDSSVPSNKDIVDDLINDFESKITDSEKTIEENEDGDVETTEEESKLECDDFVDEEKLKDIEVTLTDEEKQQRKDEAEKLKIKGNDEFKKGLYRESIDTYTDALRLCPLAYDKDRSILYSNRAASKIKLELNKTALEDCTKAVELNPEYIKVLLRRAKLYETMDKLDESLEDYKKLDVLDPTNTEVKSALYSLPIRIEKRNEEMKKEMLGKLKDLGNLILKPFGLSTENFQLNQDPNSGGYSVNFSQNKPK